MKIKKLLLVVGICVVLVATLLGCKAAPAEEKTLTYVSGGVFGCRVGIDPATAYMAGPELETLHLLFEGLVAKDEGGKIIPRLALSWEIGPDWAYIDFTLREGIKFSNGEAFTAEDAKFSIERYMREDLAWCMQGLLTRSVDRVEVLDDYQIRLYCKQPFATIFHIAADFMFMMPKDYIEEVGEEEFAQHPVGTGPCKLVDFKQDDWLHYEALDKHWRKVPEFTDYYRYMSEDAATRFAMLKTGEADIIGLNPEQIGEVRLDPDLRVILIKHVKMVSLLLYDVAYPEPTPWKDERVRRAALLALDREAIIENLMHGSAEPWECFLPPYCLGYDPSIKPEPYDPELASELLAEAGYADGFDTVLMLFPTYEYMTAIPEYWRAVGIRCEIEMVDHGTWSKRLTSQKERGTISYAPEPYWIGNGHPAGAWLDQIGKWCGVPVPDWLLEMWNKANNATSEEAIIEAGREGEKLLRESGIWLPLWSFHDASAVGPRIERFEPPAGDPNLSRFEYIELK